MAAKLVRPTELCTPLQDYLAAAMRRLALLLCLLAPLTVFATHNRAGEITYTHISGTTYEVVITTYTKSSVLADRPWLMIGWGDEGPGVLADSLERESIAFLGELADDVQVNTYRGQHTYAGPGAFTLVMEDPNRNEGVLNITASVDVPFCITSQLIIDPQAGHNNSVQLLSPARENACLGQLWEHNPVAYDPDGDLLSYDLIPCAGYQCAPIEDYVFPDAIDLGPDSFEIDPQTGTVLWDVPGVAGEYNIALRIREWRVIGPDTLLVGEVIRDMQIDVQVCPNRPPELLVPLDTCVRVGLPLGFQVSVSDPDGDDVTLTALGGLFTEISPSASFIDLGDGTGTFSWIPGCSAMRRVPWQAVFRAEDDPPSVPLVDIETVQIQVVVPPVSGVEADVAAGSVLVDWSPVTCSAWFAPAVAALGGYQVWRRVDSWDGVPTTCELGMPEGWGYTQIAWTQGLNNTGYIDSELHAFGATYCYRIVADFPDGAQSPVSAEACATIAKDVPVMTTASVLITGPAAGGGFAEGKVELAWSPPTDADTLVAFPGPYRYVLLYAAAQGALSGAPLSTSGEIVFTSAWTSALHLADTAFVHTPVESASSGGVYTVHAFSGDDLIGKAVAATTPWLLAEPHDNRIDLRVALSVPWNVDTVHFFRKEQGEDWAWVATTTSVDAEQGRVWSDTGRVNGVEACYKAELIGDYESPGVLSPIVNWSQEVCAAAWDVDPPCAPEFWLEADCAAEILQLTWSTAHCDDDDVVGYRLWHAPFFGDSLRPVLTWSAEASGGIALPFDTSYVYNADGLLGSISGCFAVTALDSLMAPPGAPSGELVRNESALSDTLCADNCPFYFLPNVFSPNHDDLNDMFVPFPWKFVDSVDFRVFNRWGELVYRTGSPELGWDGTHMYGFQGGGGKICADGVYFYAITVHSRRLYGVKSTQFSGEITIKGGLGPGAE
jgi:gliding motility-associated-like protein